MKVCCLAEEKKTFYKRLTERWQNNKPVSILVFAIVLFLAGISSYAEIANFFANFRSQPDAVFSEKVEFSFDEENLSISLTVVNTTDNVVAIQEWLPCAAYQTIEGMTIPSSTIDKLRERFVLEDAAEVSAADVSPGIIGILEAQVILGDELIPPGDKEVVTFRVRMPDGFGKDFSVDAHEFIIGCELRVGRGEAEQRIPLFPKFNQAVLD